MSKSEQVNLVVYYYMQTRTLEDCVSVIAFYTRSLRFSIVQDELPPPSSPGAGL